MEKSWKDLEIFTLKGTLICVAFLFLIFKGIPITITHKTGENYSGGNEMHIQHSTYGHSKIMIDSDVKNHNLPY